MSGWTELEFSDVFEYTGEGTPRGKFMTDGTMVYACINELVNVGEVYLNIQGGYAPVGISFGAGITENSYPCTVLIDLDGGLVDIYTTDDADDPNVAFTVIYPIT